MTAFSKVLFLLLRAYATPPFLLSPPHHTLVMSAHASGTGWGGHLDQVRLVQGEWPLRIAQQHSSSHYIRMLLWSLQHFACHLQGHTVLVCSGNVTTCAYIYKGARGRGPCVCWFAGCGNGALRAG